MFIYIAYKDAPELSSRRSSVEILDTSVEKLLLVNPDCPVRIMLEYIRKKCRLGSFTQFDLCDETGFLMGLFALNTYEYATDQFEHKKIYYVIVIKEEDKRYTILPQVNQENKLYIELQAKVKKSMMVGESAALLTGKSMIGTPALPVKTSPVKTAATSAKTAATSAKTAATSAKTATTSAKGSAKRK